MSLRGWDESREAPRFVLAAIWGRASLSFTPACKPQPLVSGCFLFSKLHSSLGGRVPK